MKTISEGKMDVEFIKGHDSTFSIRVGDKVSAPAYYQGIAQLEVDGVMYIGLSQYWEPLPAEEVLMVRRVKDAEALTVLAEAVLRAKVSALCIELTEQLMATLTQKS